jgi:hypothetical protein
VVTRATIRNVNVSPVWGAQADVFTYGMQFVNLDPARYVLQNLTYVALLEARQKIVGMTGGIKLGKGKRRRGAVFNYYLISWNYALG